MAVPGELIDLDRWYLTLPIADPSGVDDSGPWDVYQPQLDTFSQATYFKAVGTAGSSSAYVQYTAPVEGVTTSSASGATRSELREMKNNSGKDAKASWGFNDGKTHTLTCTLTCDATSVNGRKECIVGQIHDTGGTPPINLTVNQNSTGKLTIFKEGPSDGDLLTGLTGSTVFTYRIQVSGGSVKIFACLGADLNNLVLKKSYPTSDFSAQSSGCYFKAGAYNKQDISSANGGQSVVRHYRLDLDTVGTTPPPTGGPVGARPLTITRRPYNITVSGSTLEVGYYSNGSISTADTAVERVVFVIHGTDRNADDYAGYGQSAATLAGAAPETTTLVVAPHFIADTDLTSSQSGLMYWSESGWKEGNLSQDDTFARPFRMSSFEVLDRMVATAKATFPNLKTVGIIGHSAGAQYSQRYAVFTKVTTLHPTIEFRFAVANPSSYVYLDARRPKSGGFANLTSSEIAACPDYNDYKYGLVNRPSYPAAVSDPAGQYKTRKVWYLLGENDTGNTNSLDVDCGATTQGTPGRFARGTNFFNYLAVFYGSAPPSHTKLTVPGVGHDGNAMITSANGRKAIYGALPTGPTGPVSGAFTSLTVDEAAVFTFVLEGPIADTVVFPDSIPSEERFGVPTVFVGDGVNVAPTSIPSEERFGAPAVTVAAGPLTVAPTSIPSEEAFGQVIVSVKPIPVPIPENPLRVDWWAVADDNTLLCPLPQPSAWKLSLIPGQPGAVILQYPRDGINFAVLHERVTRSRDLRVEIRTDGTHAGALGALLTARDGDEVAESTTVTFTGNFLTVLLEDAVLRYNSVDDKGETHFAAATAGGVFDYLMGAAHARGTLTDLTWTFDDLTDSNGAPWPADLRVSTTFPPGRSYLKIAQQLREWGMCEFEVTTGLELRMYAPGTIGTDHTIKDTPLVLRRGRDLLDAPRRMDVRDTATDILVAGDDGVYVEVHDNSARARRGRQIEQYISQGNLTDAGSATAYGQVELARRAFGIDELTHTLTFDQNLVLPLRELQPLDWVYTDTGDGVGAPERIAQLTIAQEAGEDRYSGGVVLRDLISERDVALARELERLSGGAAVVGTSTTSGGGLDTTIPSAPTGLVASSIAYQDTVGGATLAAVSVAWSEVTTNAGGPSTEKAQAAQLILDYIRSGQNYFEDWSWRGSPDIVAVHCDELAFEFPGNSLDRDASIVWLTDYVAANSGSGSAATDIDGYKVRYAYVGASQVGGIPSSNPTGEILAYYEVTPPGGTSNLSWTFGGVDGGAQIRIEVAAFDRSGNQSAWSEPIGHDTANDNQPPPAPSTPVLSTWFRTLDTYWNGLGSSGEVMPADFDFVAVLLSQQASIAAPAVIGDPAVFDPLVVGPQFVARLYAAGTWNQPNLSVDVGWYAALVAVDRAGNVSSVSQVAGPATAKRLVTIDIGPDAITRLQIVDGEIVRAKIDELAVNSAKIEEVSVGLLTAGTMTATVTNSGLFRTAATGNRVEFDAAGLRLFQGESLVGRWATNDASMLMTGTYQSALAGERINIFPDGTLRFYPASGSAYSQISNFGNDVVWRGPMDSNQRSGRVNVNVLGVGLNFSNESEIPNNLRAEMAVFDRRTRTTAPFIHLQVSGKLPTPDGTIRRVQFTTTNSAGVDLPKSGVTYEMASSGSGGFTGNGGGIKFEANQVLVTSGGLNSFGVIKAAEFAPASSRLIKSGIRPWRESLPGRAADTVRAVRASTFHYTAELADNPDADRHVGLIVEDVDPHAPELIVGRDGPAEGRALSAMGVAATAWDAAAEAHDDLAELARRIENLAARVDTLQHHRHPGGTP